MRLQRKVVPSIPPIDPHFASPALPFALPFSVPSLALHPRGVAKTGLPLPGSVSMRVIRKGHQGQTFSEFPPTRAMRWC